MSRCAGQEMTRAHVEWARVEVRRWYAKMRAVNPRWARKAYYEFRRLNEIARRSGKL